MDYTSNFLIREKNKIHYITYPNEGPALLMMHGLTANAHAFTGLVHAGLKDSFHLISVDLRGRGLSSKLAFGYSIADHASDIIALLHHLQIESIHLCGHSFGGLLASYLAFHHPERIKKIIILDAAPEMNPKAGEMLGPALARLDQRFENFDTYIETIQKAPYITFWDEHMHEYYKADVATEADGTVEPISNLADIAQVITHTSKEPWQQYFTEIPHETLLVNAVDHYTLNEPLLPEHKADEIASKMKNATLIKVHGNHQTMLYGEYAKEIQQKITEFILD